MVWRTTPSTLVSSEYHSVAQNNTPSSSVVLGNTLDQASKKSIPALRPPPQWCNKRRTFSDIDNVDCAICGFESIMMCMKPPTVFMAASGLLRRGVGEEVSALPKPSRGPAIKRVRKTPGSHCKPLE